MPFDQTLSLNNGTAIPQLGLGTYLSASGEEVEQSVEAALEIGYRHIDTASFYRNEAGVGVALRRSGVPRGEVFITSKVWNDEQGYDETLRAFEASLGRLEMDYLDLYLVHWPRPLLFEDTWRAMETIYAEGLAKAIGVSNFLPHHMDRLAQIADVPPTVNQVEFHPSLQSPDVVASAADHNVVLEAWSPIKRGKLIDDPTLVPIAESHGKSTIQVIIRWVMQRGIVVIPKSVRRDRIQSNADVFDFELSSAEMLAIDAMDTNDRLGPHPDVFPGS